jgi:hypothetical protein
MIMSVTLFTGALLGALLGFATKNRSTSICQYLFGKHPAVAKSIGLALLLGSVLIPTLLLASVITINTTPFFWGGCWVCSFIFSFFMTSCMMDPTQQEA